MKLFYFKIFQHNSKASLCPLWRTQKKTIWRHLLSVQNEAMSLVAKRSKECDGPEKSRHCQTWLENGLLVGIGMKTYIESRTKLQNLQILKKMLKNSSHVSWQASMLPWVLQELENTLGKVGVAINTGGPSFRVVNDGGNLCPPWLIIP